MPQTAEVQTAEATPALDPYDLGDTELYPKLEAEVWKKPDAASAPVASSAEPVWIEAAGQWQHPVTKKFIGKELPQEFRSVVPTQAPVEPPTHIHPDWMVREAEALGIDPNDYTDPNVLSKTIHLVTKQKAELRYQDAAARTVVDSRPPSATREPEPVHPAAPEPLGIENEDEIHPSILQAFRNMKAEIAELRQQLSHVGQVQVRNQFTSHAQRLDNLISEHADPSLVGQGSQPWDPKNVSPQWRKRRAIRQLAAELSGNPNPSLEEIEAHTPRAIQELGWEKKKSPSAPRPPQNGESSTSYLNRLTPEEWAAAGLAPPSHRNGAPEPKGEERATIALGAKLRDFDANETKEIEDTLLP